jgi:YegS/Rv2252/BmrU family lipid kinase
MSTNRTHIVFNPSAAGGRAGKNKSKIISELHHQLGKCFDVSETLSNTDATRITIEAISSGCNLIVAVGGDGTVNQVVNGFLQTDTCKEHQARLGVISFGTGQGFAQSIGLPKDLASQITVIKNDASKLVDVGKITFENGQTAKYFLNEFQLGIGGTLCKNITSVTKMMLGRFAFGFEAVKTLLRYEAEEIQMTIHERSVSEKAIGVVIANGAYTGGGMRLTPDAKIDDGLFDVLVIEEMPLLKRLNSFSKIYSGGHICMPAFKLFKTREIKFGYSNGLSAEADGELILNKCTSAEIIHSALRVISNN